MIRGVWKDSTLFKITKKL